MSKMKMTTMLRLVLGLTLCFGLVLSAGCAGISKENQTGAHQGNGTEIDLVDEVEFDGFFPLAEKQTYTLWTIDNQNLTPGYEKTATAALMEGATNVHLSVAWVTAAEAAEKFGLMIASGDIPDMVYAGTGYYTGGAMQAVLDGVFQETTDLIEKWMPNYRALLNQNEQLQKDTTSDDGKRYSIYSIYVDDQMQVDTSVNVIGLAIRSDWLEDAGLDMPTTIDEWTRVLRAFREMGVERPLMLGSNGRLECGAFLTAYGITEEFYMDGDTVKFGPAQDAYKDYLKQMKEWYDEGLIDPNFTANNAYGMMDTQSMGGNKAGAGPIWWQFGGRELVNLGYPVEQDFFFAYAPYPVLEEGDVPKVAYESSMLSSQLCINADVTGNRLEILCRYLDYHYSRQGMLYRNYGKENLHYVVDGKGQISYAEYMTSDPDRNVIQMRIQNLAQSLVAGAISTGTNYASYVGGATTEGLDMQPTWEADTSLVYPAYATMTGEELAVFSGTYTNIMTLVDEMSTKFILGVRSLDEFDAFVDQLYQYGLENCLAYKQAAYDRYKKR